MEQKAGTAPEAASEQPTTIDEMTQDDWARARELREQFVAHRGAR